MNTFNAPRPATRIAVVVAADDEAASIGRCLSRLEVATEAATVREHFVPVHVVCDSRTDSTEQSARAAALAPLIVEGKNVLEKSGATIASTNVRRVTTGTRADYRASAGSGAALAAVADRARNSLTEQAL